MAQHVWPLLKNAALKTPSAVLVISTSGRIIAASLPPSSSRTRLKSLAQASITLLPIVVDPVKTTLRTRGCDVKISPGLGDSVSEPTTTFSTPGGSKGLRSSPMRNVVNGVCGAGFRTTVLPQASAQDVGFQAKTIGAFQGAMTATTPSGLRRTTTRFSPSSEISSSRPTSKSLAALSNDAAATKTSMRVSEIGLPLSLVCSVAKASRFFRSTAAHEASTAHRSALGISAHAAAALSAEATAYSIWSGEACGAKPTSSPVAGLVTSTVFCVR
mmetsp:Transcript_81864/g.213100  ORF Transcript_81864/g.213100 Transcript_81864/m.213100 type:complete len:272 (+) Transcript_81864:1776-2591(+)